MLKKWLVIRIIFFVLDPILSSIVLKAAIAFLIPEFLFSLFCSKDYLMGIVTMQAIYSLLKLILRIYFNEFKELLIFIMREQKQTINIFFKSRVIFETESVKISNSD